MTNKITTLSWDLLRIHLTRDPNSPNTLTLSGPNFSLTSLDGFSQVGKDFSSRLEEITAINLCGNKLETLAGLRLLRHSIRIIDASSNELEFLCPTLKHPGRNTWPVMFDKLVELDLSFNSLRSVPELNTMPNLKKLMLRHNRIVAPLNGLSSLGGLQELDLGQNCLEYETLEEFQRDAMNFVGFAYSLRVLNLEMNPVEKMFPEYRLIVMKAMMQGEKFGRKCALKTIDGMEVTEALTRRALKYAHGGGVNGVGENKVDPVLEDIDNNAVFPYAATATATTSSIPTALSNAAGETNGGKDPSRLFERIVAAMDEVLLDPNKFESVRSAVEELVALSSVWQIPPPSSEALDTYSASSGGSPLRIPEDLASEFVEKLMELTERRADMLGPVLRTLATVGGSPSFMGALGEACLEQLGSMTNANDESRAAVASAMQECVFSRLRRDDSALMLRLLRMVDDTGHPEVLSGAAPLLAKWLGSHNNSKSLNSNSSPALLLLAEAVARDPVAASTLAGAERVAETVVIEIQSDGVSVTSRSHVAALQLAAHLSPHPHLRNPQVTCASFFVSKGFHNRCVLSPLSVLVNSPTTMDSSSSSSSSSGAAPIDDVVAAHIDFLSTLTRDSAGLVDLVGSRNSRLLAVFARIMASAWRPKILASMCRAIRGILLESNVALDHQQQSQQSSQEHSQKQQPQQKEDDDEEVAETMAIRSQLHSSKSRAKLFDELTDVLRGVLPLLEILNSGSDAYAECCKRACGTTTALKLEELHNEVMHDLLVSVTELITVFNAESKTNPKAADVAKRLNVNDRERILFALLAVPSDRVKLAAVECLKEVQLEQLDLKREVFRLVAMLSSIQDVTVGRTEEVIAVSLSILTDLCMSKDFGEQFRAAQGRDSAEACLGIFERNVRRETRGSASEAAQQAILSRACLRFLQACSVHDLPVLRTRRVADAMNRILVYEDSYSEHVRAVPRLEHKEISRSEHSPTCVETISAGRQVEYLLQALLTIRAGGPVAPRLVRRIANVLCGLEDPHSSSSFQLEEELTEDPNTAWFVGVEEMRNSARMMVNDTIAPEIVVTQQAEAERRSDFFFFGEPLGSSSSSYVGGKETTTDTARQHEMFSQYQGIHRLVLHLTQQLEVMRATNSAAALLNGGVDIGDENFRGEHAPSTVDWSFLRKLEMNLDSQQQQRQQQTGKEETNNENNSKSLDFAQVLARHLQRSDASLQTLASSTSTGMAWAASNDNNDGVGIMNAFSEPEPEVLETSDLELTELVAGSCRVVFASLRFGTFETRGKALSTVRQSFFIRSLAELCMGPASRPDYARSQLGTKLFIILRETLEIPSLRRREPLLGDVLHVYGVALACADRVLYSLARRANNGGKLDPDQARLAHAAASCAALGIAQLKRLSPLNNSSRNSEEDDDEQDEWTQRAVAMLVTSRLVGSALKLMVHFSASSFVQSSAATTSTVTLKASTNVSSSRTGGVQKSFASRLREQPRDLARESMKELLAVCAWYSSPHRYWILEELVRSGVMDQDPVRPMIVRELLARVEELRIEPQLEHLVAEPHLDAWTFPAVSPMLVNSKSLAAPRSNDSSSSSPLLSWFSWCVGGARKSSSFSPNTMPSFDPASQASGLLKNQWTPYPAIQFNQQRPPTATTTTTNTTTTTTMKWWESDRASHPLERVVFHSRVEWFSEYDVVDTGKKDHVILVLTSEAMYLYVARVDLSTDSNEAWVLMWRRPYRALVRASASSCRMCVELHRNEDSCIRGVAPTTSVMILPSRLVARNALNALKRMRDAWSAVDREIGLWRNDFHVDRDRILGKLVVALEGIGRRSVATSSLKERAGQTISYLADTLASYALGEAPKSMGTSPLAILTSDSLFLIPHVAWESWRFASDSPQDDEVVRDLLGNGSKFEYRRACMDRRVVFSDYAEADGLVTPWAVLEFSQGKDLSQQQQQQQQRQADTSRAVVRLEFRDDFTWECWRRALNLWR